MHLAGLQKSIQSQSMIKLRWETTNIQVKVVLWSDDKTINVKKGHEKEKRKAQCIMGNPSEA